MASGDPVIEVCGVIPPDDDAATPDYRPGASTPGEQYLVQDFDATTDEFVDLLCRMSEKYAGGGTTLTTPWSASSATTGNAVLGAAFRRINADAEDVDTSHNYDYNLVTDAAPGTLGHVTCMPTTFTDGVDMDNVAAGELFVLRLKRDPGHANDTMAGDVEVWIWQVSGKET